uniref:Uncharacterized protein n=1 Tax=Nelumbo nucifera TaxID=4432 RepID=A0A822Z6T3_NELNU|nr:TPA_asm: hypothetical protein HUJ06_007899 [Nelumbo nucifera]
MQRVAGMITILDDVKARIQKIQPPDKKRQAFLRRCNTDLRPNRVNSSPRERRTNDMVNDEEQRLRKELDESMAARKSLERMFSSLGKEKEIMATELARKVHQLNGMEEHLNDLKAQNEMLLAKVQTCAAEHKEKPCETETEDTESSALLLQERNKALWEQLMRSLDGYRSLKKKLDDTLEENAGFQTKMAEITIEISAGQKKIQDIRQRMTESNEQQEEIEEELSRMENMFRRLEMKVSKNWEKRSECFKPKAYPSAGKPLILV